MSGMSTTDLKRGNEMRSPSLERTSDAPELSPPGPPLVQDVGVLALVPDRWDWQWQPRHQVLTRLARYFPVVWMNPAEGWRRSLASGKFFKPREERPGAGRGFLVCKPQPFLQDLYSP